MWRLLGLVALVLAASVGNAQATTINFEDHAVAPGTNLIVSGDLTSGGFLFDTLANHYHLLNNDSGVDDGSTYIGIDDFLGPDQTTFSPTAGGPFALTSIDVSEWHFDPNPSALWARQIDVTGNVFGGGTVHTLLTLDGIWDGPGGLPDFQTFSFDATWGNLSSVVLTGIGGSVGNYYGIDNVVVGAAQVPEPGTLTLLGLGSAYMVRRRRR